MRVGASLVQATGVEEVPSGRPTQLAPAPWALHQKARHAQITLMPECPSFLPVARGFVARQQLITAPRVVAERAKPALTAHTSINSRARARTKALPPRTRPLE